MQNKMFFSHSSAQKPFLEDVLKIIGHNNSIVDKYTFESGRPLWDEIRRAIDQCEIFVYLISKESLSSEWCQKEISYVRDLKDDGKIVFVPFIIDENVNINDPDIKKWIRDEYLTDTFVKPKLLAHLLKRKIRNLTMANSPIQKSLNNIFVGRELEMKNLTENYFNENDYVKSSIIVSGIPHVGRKRFLREFLATKALPNINQADPIEIRLDKENNDGIVDFLCQINDIVDVYSYEDLIQTAKDKVTFVKTAVLLLNTLHDYKEHILITDNGVIVHATGKLAEWFLDILKSDELKLALHFSIASRYAPRPDISDIFTDITSTSISTLNPTEMKTLINAHAYLYDLEIDSRDVDYLINELSGYPEQAIRSVRIIKESSFPVLKKKLPEIKMLYDKDFHPIIEEFKKDENAFQVLLLMSYFEFISYDYLCLIFGEDVCQYIERFHHYSLIESFGTGHKYLCLNSAFVDYLRRNKQFKLNERNKKTLRSITAQVINETDDRITDISYRLYATKEYLRKSTGYIDEKYLIPSLVLKVIAEEYNAKHDDTVIVLADKILNGYNSKSYEEITRSLTYWLCCALCRKKDSRFVNEVRYFEQSPYAYNFLYGFYYRHKKKYDKAFEYYQEALSQPPSEYDDNYRSKAEHEMVIVCMQRKDYDSALSLAEKSYKHNPHNTYHIEAYYRCLVRSNGPDQVVLKSLIDAMSHSYDPHRQVICDTMKAEYMAYLEGKVLESKTKLVSIIENPMNEYKAYPLRALKELCGKEDCRLFTGVIRNLQLTENVDDFDIKEDIEAY